MSNQMNQRIAEFNAQVLAMQKLGLPLNLGFDDRELEPQLAGVAQQIANAETIADVEQVAARKNWPARYRMALLAYCETDQSDLIFDSLLQSEESQQHLRRRLSSALLQPTVVVALAYGGLIAFCYAVFPKIEAFYRDSFAEPTPVLLFLTQVRDTLPIWSWVFPLAVFLVALLWVRFCEPHAWKWVPGSSSYSNFQNNARVSANAAQLVDRGNSMESVQELVDRMGGPALEKRTLRDSGLIQWALGDSPQPAKSKIFRLASIAHRRVADQHSRRWRSILPALLSVFIGGVVVAIYGIALFLPLSELLNDIASVGGF